MKEVLRILDQLAAVSSKKEKKEIIKDNVGNDLFMKVAKYALDQNRSFNLTELPVIPYHVLSDLNTFKYLDFLSAKRGATLAEATTLARTCHDYAAREVVTRILNKDLRCGTRSKSFNSVVKNHIYQVPYQRYKSFAYINDIDFENEEVIAQLKLDGMFAYFIPSEDRFISRQGNSFSLTDQMFEEALTGWVTEVEEVIAQTPLVWMGEVLVEVDGKYLPRKTGNGIINKFISGEGDSEYEDCIRYVTWGFVTKTDYDNRESNQVYSSVLNEIYVAQLKYDEGKFIKMSVTTPVTSLTEALDFYKDVRSRDEEGAMVKVASKLTWKDQQSGTKYGVKLKPAVEAEFEIVSAYYGNPKHKWAELLGGITVKSACGGIVSNLGGGFSDQERELGVEYWNQQVGKIVTGKFTGLITDKSDRQTMCLDHGRFVETRFNEKEEADTLEYCLEELKNA